MADLVRRNVSKWLSAGVVAIPVSVLSRTASGSDDEPSEAKKPLVDHKTTTAKALAYMQSSDKSNQNCSNCAVYKAYEGLESGDCPLFLTHRVGANAWCSAWSEKA